MAIDVGTAYVNILPSTRGLGAAVAGEFATVGQQADKAGDEAGKKMGGGLKRAFKGALAIGGGLLALTGAAAIGGQFVDAIKQAGELEQNVGALDAVFKGNAGQMNDWAKTAASAVGLSRNEYSQLATVLGSQLKNGGMEIDKIGGKTNDLIGVGADLSSMFGGTTVEAVEAMSSALRGETDPIERYGVSLSAAKVESEALAMGAEKVNGELPQQAKQAAILSLIMKQTADAQGNFARETDTLAGKQQIARAEWANLKTEIGERFLPAASAAMTFVREVAIPGVARLADFIGNKVVPAFTDAARVVNDKAGPAVRAFGGFITGTLVPALVDAARWVRDNKDTIVPLVTVLGSAALAYVAVTRAIVAGKAAYLGIKAAIVAVKAAQFGLNIVMAANPIGIVIAAIVALGVAMVLMYRKSETFRRIVDGAWAGIKAAAKSVSDWWTNTVVPTFRRNIELLTGYYRSFRDNLGRVWDWVTSRTDRFLGYFRGFRDNSRRELDNIVGFFRRMWDGINSVYGWVTSRIERFGRWFDVQRGAIRYRLALIGDYFGHLWQRVRDRWDNITGKIRGGWDFVKRVAFDPLVHFVRNVIPDAFARGRDAIGRHWDGLKSKVRGPIDFFVNTAYNNGLRKAVNGVLEFVRIDKRLPRMDMPRGFFRGGRTGGASPYEERGVVHGKEFVLDHRRTQEADRLAPGFLDTVHKRGFGAAVKQYAGPGTAVYGGPRSFGNGLQHAIYRTGVMNVHPIGGFADWDLNGAIAMMDRATSVKVRKGGSFSDPYGGNTVHVHRQNTSDWWAGYYQGNMIGLNDRTMGRASVIQRRTVAAHELGHALGLPHSARMHGGSGAWSIMNYDNQYAHNSVTAADVAALKAIYGGSGQGGGGGILAGLTDRFLGPLKAALKGLVESTMDKFRGNIVGDMMGGVGKTIGKHILDFVKSKVPDLGGLIPKLFDGGGLLTQGTHVVRHNGTQPDRVLTAQQWRAHYDVADWARRQQAGDGGSGKLVENLYALDIDEALQKLYQHKARREALAR